jgi:hypothetical protein
MLLQYLDDRIQGIDGCRADPFPLPVGRLARCDAEPTEARSHVVASV